MRRANLRRTFLLLLPTLAAITVLAPGAAVAQPAQQTDLSIHEQADYIASFRIIVYVSVDGIGGFGNINVNVQQPQPFFGTAFGFGNRPIVCDGQRRTYAIDVFGGGMFGPGFALGEALATASAFCPVGPADFETRTIRISKP
jgi:hypothetical protein